MVLAFKFSVGPFLIEYGEDGFYHLAWRGRFEVFPGWDGRPKFSTPAREAREDAEFADGDARRAVEALAFQAA